MAVFTVTMLQVESIPNTLLFAMILIIAIILMVLQDVLMVSLAIGEVTLEKKELLVICLNAIKKTAGMNILYFDKTLTITNIT